MKRLQSAVVYSSPSVLAFSFFSESTKRREIQPSDGDGSACVLLQISKFTCDLPWADELFNSSAAGACACRSAGTLTLYVCEVNSKFFFPWTCQSEACEASQPRRNEEPKEGAPAEVYCYPAEVFCYTYMIYRIINNKNICLLCRMHSPELSQ